MGGQGGCDRRIEKFLGKSTKKKSGGGGSVWGGGGGGVRVDVNEELKFLCKFNFFFFFFFWGGGGGSGWGSQDGCERRIEVFLKIQKKKKRNCGGGGSGGSGWGVRVDVNEELKFL